MRGSSGAGTELILRDASDHCNVETNVTIVRCINAGDVSSFPEKTLRCIIRNQVNADLHSCSIADFAEKNLRQSPYFSKRSAPVDGEDARPSGTKKPPESRAALFAIFRLLQKRLFCKSALFTGCVRFAVFTHLAVRRCGGFREGDRGRTPFRNPEKVFARRFLFGRNQEDMRSRHSVECRTVRSSALGAQAVRRALMRAETLPRSARPFTRGFTRAMTLPMAAMPVRPTAAVASSMIAAISSSVSA